MSTMVSTAAGLRNTANVGLVHGRISIQAPFYVVCHDYFG